MPNGERLRAGVVGTGHMGQYHVLVYAELADAALVGVADIDADRAKSVASRYETEAFSDHRDLIGRVDVASVAVPTEQHFHVARDLLEAGISVLVEKPMTPTLEEARELFAVARRAERSCTSATSSASTARWTSSSRSCRPRCWWSRGASGRSCRACRRTRW